jgi:hypothetical protein
VLADPDDPLLEAFEDAVEVEVPLRLEAWFPLPLDAVVVPLLAEPLVTPVGLWLLDTAVPLRTIGVGNTPAGATGQCGHGRTLMSGTVAPPVALAAALLDLEDAVGEELCL